MRKSKTKKSKKHRNYAGYVRVSTEEQARSQEGSIRSQTQRLEEFIKIREGNINYRAYIEEGRSAKDTKRPEYQKLIADIKQGKVNTILCTDLSRISRSTIDFLNFIEFCNEHDTEFISLKEEHFDTTTAIGKVMITICVALAQFEREQVSERTKVNRKARARRGLWNGGFLYGYRPRVGKPGYLDVKEDEAELVKIVFAKYLEFGSAHKVAKWMNTQGYQYCNASKRLTNWKKKTVLKMLQNISYIAKIVVDDDIVKAVWEPVIPEEKWQKAQKLLEQNRNVRHNTTEPNRHHTYILTNLNFCSHCGIKLENGAGTSRNGKLYFYYRHPEGTRKAGCPYPHSIPAQEFEEVVCREILKLLADEDILPMIISKATKKFEEESASYKAQIRLINKQIQELHAKADLLLDNIENLKPEQVREYISPKLDKITENKRLLEDSKADLENQLEFLEAENLSVDDIHQLISSIAGELVELKVKQKQNLFGMLVQRIDLQKDKVKVYLRSKKKSPRTNSVREEDLLAPQYGLEPQT